MPNPRGRHASGPTAQVLRDPDRLGGMYREHGTLRGVADVLDVDPMTVRRWLLRHGVPIARRGPAGPHGWGADRLADRVWLYRAYVRDRRTCEDIAGELGCSVQTVANQLATYGIPKRPSGNPVAGRAARRLSDADWLHEQIHTLRRPYRDVAADLDVSVRTIENYLDSHGIPRSSARNVVALRPDTGTGTADRQVA